MATEKINSPSSSTSYPLENFNLTNKQENSRVELIQTAQQFLQNPRVCNTPIEDQIKFLREKGLSEAEIKEAFDSLPKINKPQNNTTIQTSQQNLPTNNSYFSSLQTAVIVGSASYLAYKFVRSWILPKFFNIPDPVQEQHETLQSQLNDLQNSTKFVIDSVVQTLETVSAQQEQFNRALLLLSNNGTSKGNDLEKIHADIEIVKSLLLNQNQFPPIPECYDTKPTTNGKDIVKLTNCVNE